MKLYRERMKNNPEYKQKRAEYRKKYGSHKQSWFKKIAERDGAKCKKCKSLKNLTLEHKKPQSIGGKFSYENLEILCLPCNVKAYRELVDKALRAYFKNI